MADDPIRLQGQREYERQASYESLKIAHDYDEAEVRRLRPLLATAEAEIARLRAELKEVECFRAAPLATIRKLLGDEESPDEAIAGSVCAVIATHRELGRRKRVAEKERDEAREWVRKLTRENVLTCVYCGHEYPPGTPAANDDALTAHIAQCTKHPMFALRTLVTQLVGALRRITELPGTGAFERGRDIARDALVAAEQAGIR